jgi:hypothetical protein
MSLQDTEIQPGCYAWFDVKKLLADKRVEHKAKTKFRDGPFICVQAKDARSVWVELTRQDGAYGREWLKDEWRLEGDPQWLDGKSYFNSLNETFIGPNAAFVDAAASEPAYTPYTRPQLSVEGVEFALKRLKFNGAPLLK